MLFLATLLWLGWDGGAVGEKIADGLHGAFGAAAYVVPLVLLGLGGLMLVRSKLVDLKPFRTGLAIGAFGLMLALGRDQGGMIGGGLSAAASRTSSARPARSSSGSRSSLPARCSSRAARRARSSARSGSAMRRAGGAARRSFDGLEMPDFGGSDDSTTTTSRPSGSRSSTLPRPTRT